MRRSLERGIGCFVLAWVLLATGGALAAEPTVLLLSFDGTRPDQIRRPGLPTFERLLREGASAERLEPVFPTNTFPNHVSLATGVAPERHGIVNNVFLDRQRGRFSYDDDPTWIEVPPVWAILSAHGVRTASYHWVGSEGPWRDGRGPHDWRRFDASTPANDKVDQILEWLDRPPAKRPRLITAWFPGADSTGHSHGPDSPAVTRALARQDASLGRLVAGLETRGLRPSTTLLVVSDHGMAPVERRVDLQDAFDRAGVPARVLGGGGVVLVRLRKGGRAEEAIEVARELGLEAYQRERAPFELRVSNDRFGDLVVLAPVGTAVARGTRLRRLAAWLGIGRASLAGAHGYRVEEETMGGMLLAFGRGAEPGEKLGRVRVLDVLPTVLALLGVPPPEGLEGDVIGALLPSDAGTAAGAGS